jgi:hypothetical protein
LPETNSEHASENGVPLNIDWKHERLQIRDRKVGNCTAYPLAGVVAEALIEYLKNGRPETANDAVVPSGGHKTPSGT